MTEAGLGARLLHPTSGTQREVLEIEALLEMAAGLASIGRSVPPGPAFDPETPRSIRLLGTAAYDVWLVTWPPGTGLATHDHGDSVAVLHVVSGALVEATTTGKSASQTRPDRLVETGPTRLLPSGTVTTCRDGQAHELWNRSLADATTVHVYSPPLVSARRVPTEATSAPEA